jgi:hypothetical protein
MMPDLKDRILNNISSVNIVVTGPFNSSLLSQPGLGAYSTSSYTVGEVIEAADSEPLGAPYKPLHADAVRALNSVLRSDVPDSAILRDTSGEL